MARMTRLSAGAPAFLLAACVTVNIYFPAAAAERAADRVIREVWGEEPAAPPTAPGVAPSPAPEPTAPARPTAPEGPAPSSREEQRTAPWLAALADLVVRTAAAQADIDVSSPAIRAIAASMERRHRQLEPLYASGAVGLTRDGLVTVRDPAAVPLARRRDASQLVADENRDRNALYREVAVANGHPEWEPQIRETFARRWVANARPGWWHEGPGGTWSQK
jgi:uncharacterized protein YdbL (DUF1318 family)